MITCQSISKAWWALRPRSKTIRTIDKVLFVNRRQQHHYRPLENLVLQRRDADGPLRLASASFGNVHATHRRRPVGSGFEPLQKRGEIALQFLLILGGRHPVHSRSSVLARLPVRLPEPVHIHMMRKGCEHRLGHPPRKLCYPLLFRVHVVGSQCIHRVSHQRVHVPTRSFPPPALSGQIRRLHRYYDRAKTPCRPPKRLRRLRLLVPSHPLVLRVSGRLWRDRFPSGRVFTVCPPSAHLCRIILRWNDEGLPGSRGVRPVPLPCSRDPGRAVLPCRLRQSGVAPAKLTTKAAAFSPFRG